MKRENRWENQPAADLKLLKEKAEHRVWIERRLSTLEGEITHLTQRGEELYRQLKKEEADVQEVETGGIHSFFRTVFRSREAVLERERLEAAAAGAKYETAMQELSQLNEERDRLRQEYSDLDGCDVAYRQCYQKRAEELLQRGGEAAEEILQSEAAIGNARARLREIEEARLAAESAEEQLRFIQKALSSAESFGVWDMMGGGVIASVAKRSRMDEAERALPELQRRLNRLSAELRDVEIFVDHQISGQDFLRFADWFFDNFFVDWAVQDQIHKFQGEMEAVQSRIGQEIFPMLSRLRSENERAIEQLQQRIQERIMEGEGAESKSDS